MRQIYYVLLCFIFQVTASCIGTDEIYDPDFKDLSRIEITQKDTALKVNEMLRLTARYIDMRGIEQNRQISWSSSDNFIVSVSQDGTITGLSKGQVKIFAFSDHIKDSIFINIVDDLSQIASIVVLEGKSSIQPGETASFIAKSFNIEGTELNGKEYTWESSHPTIVSIDDNGLATGVAAGTAYISAISEGVSSNLFEVKVASSNVLTGTFQDANGYNASGTATLTKEQNGTLILEFDNSFTTDFALGTFVYLSNTTMGSGVISTGLEIAQITTNGSKSFNISEINSNVELDDYKYVIILCKPAQVTFGYAELK